MKKDLNNFRVVKEDKKYFIEEQLTILWFITYWHRIFNTLEHDCYFDSKDKAWDAIKEYMEPQPKKEIYRYSNLNGSTL